MSVDFPPLRRQMVPDQVAATIRDKILRGELAPGQHLREAELAEKLGVGRGAVREAFRQLIGEHLLVTHPHRGTFVWQPTRHELWELFTLRAAIEGMCVRLILEMGKREELVATLHAIVEEMEAAEASGNRPESYEERFHEAIVRLSGNRRIWQIWSSAHPAVWLADLPALVPEDWAPLSAHHRSLVEVLAQATPLEAQEALITHILQGMQAAQALRDDAPEQAHEPFHPRSGP